MTVIISTVPGDCPGPSLQVHEFPPPQSATTSSNAVYREFEKIRGRDADVGRVWSLAAIQFERAKILCACVLAVELGLTCVQVLHAARVRSCSRSWDAAPIVKEPMAVSVAVTASGPVISSSSALCHIMKES